MNAVFFLLSKNQLVFKNSTAESLPKLQLKYVFFTATICIKKTLRKVGNSLFIFFSDLKALAFLALQLVFHINRNHQLHEFQYQ